MGNFWPFFIVLMKKMPGIAPRCSITDTIPITRMMASSKKVGECEVIELIERFALLWCGCFESPPDADNGVRTPNAGHFHSS